MGRIHFGPFESDQGAPRGLPRGEVYSMAIITAGLCND